MHPVVRGSIATVPKISIRPSYRRIANRRIRLERRYLHQTRCLRESDVPNKPGQGQAVGDITNGQEDAEGKGSPIPTSTALSTPAIKDLTHYGSAARRSQRNRTSPSVHIPKWFVEDNVILVEDVGNKPFKLLKWDGKRLEYVTPSKDLGSTCGRPPKSDPTRDSGNGPVPEETAKTEAEQCTQYYLDSSQWEELASTASGLLKLSADPTSNDIASRKNNLMVHYASEDGHYLLDGVIPQLAAMLQADVVALDALDIAELASEPHNSSLTDDKADDRRLFTFDVYDTDESRSHEVQVDDDQVQEMEGQDGENDPGVFKPSIPTIFLDVRGPNFNPDHNKFSRLRRSGGSTGLPKAVGPNLSSFLADRLGTNVERQKNAPPQLLPLVQALLAGPHLKRSLRATNVASSQDLSGSPANSTMKKEPTPLIVAIPDLKLIQRTAFGAKFLSVLYEDVQARRQKGQRVMIIGTSIAMKDTQYSAEALRSLQEESPDNISRMVAITPTIPSEDARNVLRRDLSKRLRTINLRNLWQMLCIKMPDGHASVRNNWQQMIEGPNEEICYALNLTGAEREIWSFDYVHRLTTLMVGCMDRVDGDNIQDHLSQACIQLAGSDATRKAWTHNQRTRRAKSKPDLERRETPRLEKIRKKANKYEKKLIHGVIEPEKIATTFDHVHVPPDIIDALKTLTTLSLVRPDAFKYGILASDRIPGLLLYGPPGTGKTLLAKAVAKESAATVLEVSGAELNDMYVGEGEKNVRALFSLAKKLTPCVVFIDEADAVFSARGGGHRRVSHTELLNQFLREWDGMSNDAGSAFIMVATNRPFDLDDAVLRRLPRRLLVDLPSENDRLEILKIHLRDEKLSEDVSLTDIAAGTPFYSGSDLKNLCVAAALNCVREENALAQDHTGDEVFEYAETRTLTGSHFQQGLEDISASISEDMSSLKQIKKFDEQFGDRRGKSRKSPKWGFNTLADANRVLDTVKVRS